MSVQGKLSGQRKALHNDKGSILQEDLTVFNAFVPDNKMSNYVILRLIELKGERDESTIIIEYINSPLSAMDRSKR